MLNRTPISVPFIGGVDTKSDEKTLPASKLARAENAVFTKRGSLRKRPGRTALSQAIVGGGTITDGRALLTRGDELALCDADTLYSYAPEQSAWSERGPLVSVVVDLESVVNVAAEQTLADRATVGGVTVYAWEDSRGGVRYSLVSESSGAVLYHDEVLSAGGSRPKCLAVGDNLLVFFAHAASLELRVKVIPTTNIATGVASAPKVLLSTITTPALYDVCQTHDDRAVLSCLVGANVVTGYVLPSGLYDTTPGYATTSLASTATALAVAINDDDSFVAVVTNETTNRVQVAPLTGATLVADEVAFDLSDSFECLRLAAAFDSAGVLRVFAEEIDANTGYVERVTDRVVHALTATSLTVGALDTVGLEIRKSVIASRAYQVDGVVYGTIAHESALQSTYFTVRHSDLLLVSRILPGTAGGAPFGDVAHLPQVEHIERGDGEAVTAGPYTASVRSSSEGTFDGTDTLTFLRPIDTVTGEDLLVICMAYDDIADDNAEFQTALVADGWSIPRGRTPLEDLGFYLAHKVATSAASFSFVASSAVANALGVMFAVRDVSTTDAVPYSSDAGEDVNRDDFDSATLNVDARGLLFTVAMGKVLNPTWSQGALAASGYTASPASGTVEANITNTDNGVDLAMHVVSESYADAASGRKQVSSSVNGSLRYSSLTIASKAATTTTVYDPGRHAMAAGYRTRLDSEPAGVGAAATDANEVYAQRGIKSCIVDFDNAQAHRSVEQGGATYITGGFLWQFDGLPPVESGFLMFTESLYGSGTTLGIGAGALTAGSYTYRVYPEWQNAKGEREQGTCAAVVSVAISGPSNEVLLAIQTIAHTTKTEAWGRSPISWGIYRTEVDPTADSPLYRVSSLDPNDISAGNNTNNSYMENDVTVDYVQFFDGMSDAVLITQELDYQNGRGVQNQAPAAASVIGAAGGRVVLAGFEQPGLVEYAQLHAPGMPLRGSAVNQIICPEDGGAVTGLAPLNDSLVIFAERQIYVVPGFGPDAQAFPSPQLVTGDAGCTNQRSIVQTPQGLMFQSAKGIYLLTQSLQLVYIGADVEAYNAQIITAATLLADANQVLFLVEDGSALLYDYLFGQWATFSAHEGVDALVWDGSYVYARSNGEVLVEAAADFRDAGAPYRMRLKTGWIHPAGIQGYQCISEALVIGTYKSAHTLRVKIYADYEQSAFQTVEFDPSQCINTSTWGSSATWGSDPVWGGEGSRVYQFRIFLERQKFQAIAFSFEDVPGEVPGESYELAEVRLLVGVKPGSFKLPSTKIAGG